LAPTVHNRLPMPPKTCIAIAARFKRPAAAALMMWWLLAGCSGNSASDKNTPAGSAGSSRGGASQGGGGTSQGGGGTSQGGGGTSQGGGGTSQGGGGTSQGGDVNRPCPPPPAPVSNPEGCPQQGPISQGLQGPCALDPSVVCTSFVSTQINCPVGTLPVEYRCCDGSWQSSVCQQGAAGSASGGAGGSP
jgi:hypothetical protein